MLHNTLMRGRVVHRRALPKAHQFTYPLSMFLLDLDAPEAFFRDSLFVSYRKFNLASFYPEDYLGRSGSLKQNCLEVLKNHGDPSFSGKIFILTQVRRLGFVFNPVSFYFCVDEQGQLRFIISEIENTPWRERFSYVHRISDSGRTSHTFRFGKKFHISPFMPMDIVYDWSFQFSDSGIRISMNCKRAGKHQFRASLSLKTVPCTGRSTDFEALKGCFATVLILAGIYLQALKLFLKKVPFYKHPEPLKRKEPLKWQKN